MAYEKDSVTGSRPTPRRPVHRVSATACSSARTYVPKLRRASRGIVRKCDMCSPTAWPRAKRTGPACRAARPRAISDRDRRAARSDPPDELIPDARTSAPCPPRTYTRPSTRYVTERRDWRRAATLARMRRSPRARRGATIPLACDAGADAALDRASSPIDHFARSPAGSRASSRGSSRPRTRRRAACSPSGSGVTAHAPSGGDPLYAFRAFLGLANLVDEPRDPGLRPATVPAVVATAAAARPLAQLAAGAGRAEAAAARPAGAPVLGSLGAGALALLCSVMIYVDTRGELWSLGRTAAALRCGTALLLLGCPLRAAATGLAASAPARR